MLNIRTDEAGHSGDNQWVNFTATSDGIMIPCAVYDETLQILSGDATTEPDALIAVLHQNQRVIEEIVTARWKKQALEEDGYVIVTPEDIRHYA